MQYENNRVSASQLKNSVSDAKLSASTQAAINKILNLDSLTKHGKDVVIADKSYTAEGASSTLDLTQDLKQVKGEKVVMLNLTAAPDQLDQQVTLTLPSTTAKTFVFNSDVDLHAAFKASGSVIISGSGSDELTIRGSKNIVEAGDGDDKVTTSSGNDTINGGEGNDNLNGGSGNDSISGGNGNDTIDGGNGNDKLYGDAGNDSISGGNGNDKLYGGEGNDTISGGNSNDTIEGGAGNDTLDGGKGNDTFIWNAEALQARGVDQLIDGKGSKLVINFEGMKVNDQVLYGDNALSKGTVHVGGTIDADNNIALKDNTLQIDLNNDGHFDAANDFQIEIVGTVKGVDFNAKTDTFTLI